MNTKTERQVTAIRKSLMQHISHVAGKHRARGDLLTNGRIDVTTHRAIDEMSHALMKLNVPLFTMCMSFHFATIAEAKNVRSILRGLHISGDFMVEDSNDNIVIVWCTKDNATELPIWLRKHQLLPASCLIGIQDFSDEPMMWM